MGAVAQPTSGPSAEVTLSVAEPNFYVYDSPEQRRFHKLSPVCTPIHPMLTGMRGLKLAVAFAFRAPLKVSIYFIQIVWHIRAALQRVDSCNRIPWCCNVV